MQRDMAECMLAGVDVVPAYVVLSNNVQPEDMDHHYVVVKPVWVGGFDSAKQMCAMFTDGMRTTEHGVKGGWSQMTAEVLSLDGWVVNMVCWMPLTGGVMHCSEHHTC